MLAEVRQYSDPVELLDICELVFSDKSVDGIHFSGEARPDNLRSDLPYYKKLRRHIGQDRLFSCGMSVIVENELKQVALTKRVDDGRWAFPAGAKELHESLEQTMHKECMEELGIEVTDPVLLAVFSGPKCKSVYPNGDKMHWFSFLFKARHAQGELTVKYLSTISAADI